MSPKPKSRPRVRKPKPYPYELATPEQRALGWMWFALHHEILAEPLTEPIEQRVAYIRAHKPVHEQETRLRSMRPASPEAHAALEAARKAWDEALEAARKAWDEALAAARKAWDEAVAPARKAWDEAVRPWFRRECRGVKLGRNGLVFPKAKRKGARRGQ